MLLEALSILIKNGRLTKEDIKWIAMSGKIDIIFDKIRWDAGAISKDDERLWNEYQKWLRKRKHH